MTTNYRAFFGMTSDAFPQDLALKDILETHDISQITERLDYVLAIGAIGLITGEVGSGKSTAIRYVLSKLLRVSDHLHHRMFRLYIGILSPALGRAQH